MENQQPTSDNDSDVIMVDNPPETITITESPEKQKKIKTKKQRKRMVRQAISCTNHNMETLLMTQKLQLKRTKFRCIINIDTSCKRSKKQSGSIIRFRENVCNAQAYYERIVPICLRNKCFHCQVDEMAQVKCCKLEPKKESHDSPLKRNGIYSPISSIALTERERDISYEDVSNGDFPDSDDLCSEEELDTLIKRTKEREKLSVDTLGTFPLYTSSPLYTEEASTSSVGSTHSKATLVLAPGIEAYSPTMSPSYTADASPYHNASTESIRLEGVTDEHVDPYSPTDPTVTPPRFGFGEANPNFTTQDNRAGPLFKVEKENKNNLSDLIKTEMKSEIVETRNFNSLINTEEIFVNRENGSDVNANFEVYIKTETPINWN